MKMHTPKLRVYSLLRLYAEQLNKAKTTGQSLVYYAHAPMEMG